VCICILPYFSRPRGDCPLVLWRHYLRQRNLLLFFIILPNSDTFSVCSFIGTETRTEFCAVRLLWIPDSGKTGDWMKVFFFFLVPFYYFVGTNKYNLCQGCLRGGFDVGHFRYKRTRLVHRTLGRPMTSSDPPTPLGLVCRSFFANQFIDRPLDGITSHF
jgi:hypothetical protein